MKGTKKYQLQLEENDYFSQDDKQISHLKNYTTRPVEAQKYNHSFGVGMPKMGTTKNINKINNNLISNSTPEFNLLQNKLSKQYNTE